MTDAISPLTPDLWPHFEDLFGKQGACYGCWCTYFRLPPAIRRDSNRESNKDHIKARIAAGPPPGLLAFSDGQAVGWMQIGPRADVPEFNNAGRGSAPLAAQDAGDPAVWAISCFFIRGNVRGLGMTHRLVEAGIAYARQAGARVLEACPIDKSNGKHPASLFVGSTRVFDKVGFTRVIERKPGRPLMRLEL
ncbi:acetyltransferase (GNAT) family protein [Aminobacter aminovorans]|uniref:N-acetyltransferase domain-containing protein n=1 Tax=Aminobacter aminovorans TaxID=83263 RepID=A0A380WMI7_AMIAI|nr:GNAT family N-acetyltransferase [Aminobacter aminovorans]TCS26215.1 acetyltransferase (GNAT) family protein [Aminobacter aminovorans]SUU90121.1 Uncharacterised protein [Aminobacter aminovorans]